ncbi:transposase [Dickeya chrysanthemi]|uniref:transposase n=1 Tax=Dickeya chrysanthemi TaxID=556 RepID=UPI003AFB529A
MLHSLPPHSQNLNTIERVWKVMNTHTQNNRYVENVRKCRNAVFNLSPQRH